MSEFEVKPGRRRKAFACLIAIAGACSLAGARASDHLVGAILLLTAWELAFVPSLPLNLTFGEIHRRARQGWRMTWTSRAIGLATIAMAVYAGYLKWHGR